MQVIRGFNISKNTVAGLFSNMGAEYGLELVAFVINLFILKTSEVECFNETKFGLGSCLS